MVKFSLFFIPLLIMFPGCSKSLKFVTACYSSSGEKGINVFDLDITTGKIEQISSFNAGPDPSYLCLPGKFKLFYAINEVSGFMNEKAGGITTVSYTGNFENLTKAGEIAVPNGGPCYISISPGSDFLLVANYGGGSVAVVRLDEAGIPSEVTDTLLFNGIRGKKSHAHMINYDPSGKRVYVTDLGLDSIMVYTLDRISGKLAPVEDGGATFPPGTGPRHFVFNTAGDRLYVLGELNSTVTVFDVNKEGGLKRLQTISTLRGEPIVKNASADIHIGRSGEFLYASNRGENTIATYRIGADGSLILSGHSDCGGNWPRNFVTDPSGKYILVGNQRSDNIAVFKIDRVTGIPSEKVGDASVKAPSCLKF
jgi:6-phosphogluconolactonase